MDYDYEIEFTTKSISDLENIFNYILEISKSIDTAKKISMRIKTSIYHLGIFPKKFSLSNNYKYKKISIIIEKIIFFIFLLIFFIVLCDPPFFLFISQTISIFAYN